jgi:hypothetical protein
MHFLSLLLFATFVGAQEPVPQAFNPEELFSQGTQLYQSSRYAEAAEKFKDLASRNPTHAPIFLNWGLSEYMAGRRGWGVALWRRALALRPGFPDARDALSLASQQMQLREADLWFERMRQLVLVHVSLNQLLAVLLVFLAPSGWLLVNYFGRRRRALAAEEPLPPAPWIGAALLALFLGGTGLTVMKAFEQSTPRATAVSVVPVRSAPSETSSTLFELREGSDVILRQAKKGWTQIRYPGGMSGWVPSEALFQTSGMRLW